MKYIFAFLIVSFAFTSCNKKKAVENSSKTKPQADKIIQDSTNILGDKIIISETTDLNGLTSPDTIFLVAEFDDSSEASIYINNGHLQLLLLNCRNYYFPMKSKQFVVYSKKRPTGSSTEKTIYKIRPDNFTDDINLAPEELDSAYKNYKVIKLAENLYCIRPKKYYDYARVFSRLILFDQNAEQKHAITINDFELTDFEITNTGYVLGMNDFGLGSTHLFTDTTYSIRIVWLDKQLNITGNYQAFLESTQLDSVKQTPQGLIATFELHVGCDECENGYVLYDVLFNNRFWPVSVKVKQHPSKQKINEPALLDSLKKSHFSVSADLMTKR